MFKTDFKKMETRGVWKQLGYLAIGSFGVTWLLNRAFNAGCEHTAGRIGSELENLQRNNSNDKESE